MEMGHEHYDIEVELTLYTPEEVGRNIGLPVIFHNMHIYLDGIEWIARFTLQNRERLNPGETGRAFVTFFYCPHALLGRLHPGKAFSLHEGVYPIGEGTILAMLNFEHHAEVAKQQEAEERGQLEDPTRKRYSPPWARPRHRSRKKKNRQSGGHTA